MISILDAERYKFIEFSNYTHKIFGENFEMDLFPSSIFIHSIIHTKFTIIPLRLKSQKLLETFQYYAIRESGYFLYYFT